jgi:hypothetical protein
MVAGAQVDLKLNAGSLLTLGLSASGEFVVSPRSSLAFGVARSAIALTIDDDTFDYRNLRVIPEYRYYFTPRLGHDRWFAGGYSKLIGLRGRASDDDRRVTATRMALGVMAGHKWVMNSGFIVEANVGLGGGTIVGGNDFAFRRAIGTLTPVDIRLGFLVGWRL